MKKIFSTAILSVSLVLGGAVSSEAQEIKVEKCGIKSKTSFAIFTDSRTLSECGDELREYKKVLEEEGLGTWIVSAEWNSPEQVKEQILSLYGKKPRLEGVVFAGDIPIIKVREAQHLTTAFKMNEKTWPMAESSVASDRFYDDFSLRFDFICRDTVQTDVFYYRLSEKGAQHLNPDIYSARMTVPGAMQGDRYEILRKYLRKVVKVHREQNPLDCLTYFVGSGYNSDCLTIWRQKPLVFREYFPYAFDRASQARFLNFREHRKMKTDLLSEVSRDGLDLFVFSEHGAPDTQYINESRVADGLDEDIDFLKRTLAGMYSYYQKKGYGEEFLHEALDSVFSLPRKTVSDSALRGYALADSLEFEDANIFLKDIMRGRSNARMIVFNACYNGSFHDREGYVAGCHVFGDGECVVAQGNTVNVLQDKWEDKLMGYLSIGERVGMWQKEVPYLESHLIGDPTFHFTPHNAQEKKRLEKLHYNLVFNSAKSSVWERYTHSEDALERCAGIVHLGYIDPQLAHGRASQMMEDSLWIVRMHAFNVLSSDPEEDFSNYVRRGLRDSYELIVRNAVKAAAASGDTTLISDLKAFKDSHPEMVRASGYAADDAIAILSNSGHYGKSVRNISNKSLPVKRRLNEVRTFRNAKSVFAIEPLLAVVADASEDSGLRTSACETLGWYTQSSGRGKIISSLTELLESELPDELRSEIVKTIKRLRWE